MSTFYILNVNNWYLSAGFGSKRAHLDNRQSNVNLKAKRKHHLPIAPVHRLLRPPREARPTVRHVREVWAILAFIPAVWYRWINTGNGVQSFQTSTVHLGTMLSRHGYFSSLLLISKEFRILDTKVINKY